MDKKYVPFWLEKMSEVERKRKVKQLFYLLEQSLISKAGEITNEHRIYVFVPDPPPIILNTWQNGKEYELFLWGKAGKAIATASQKCAFNLAFDVFDLLADILHVLSFQAYSRDIHEIKIWTEIILGVRRTVTNSDASGVLQLPHYGILEFDWGDLVVNDNPHLQ